MLFDEIHAFENTNSTNDGMAITLCWEAPCGTRHWFGPYEPKMRGMSFEQLAPLYKLQVVKEIEKALSKENN